MVVVSKATSKEIVEILGKRELFVADKVVPVRTGKEMLASTVIIISSSKRCVDAELAAKAANGEAAAATRAGAGSCGTKTTTTRRVNTVRGTVKTDSVIMIQVHF